MSPVTRCLVRPDTYRDSVVLMRVAAELEQIPGVVRAALMMATPANRALLAEAGLLDGDAVAAGPGDLVIAVTAADASVAGDALASAARFLDRSAAAPASAAETVRAPRTIAEAAALVGANLAMISTPGAYATRGLEALKRGLSVFLFSDNVPIEDEIELKRLAAGKRLSMCSIDCGGWRGRSRRRSRAPSPRAARSICGPSPRRRSRWATSATAATPRPVLCSPANWLPGSRTSPNRRRRGPRISRRQQLLVP